MSQNHILNIGLFGFGVVGEGIYHVLHQTASLKSNVKKICIKHKEKERNAPEKLFTIHAHDLIHDPEINVIVELIDNVEEAYAIVTEALRNKKHVVSANKKMISQHFEELIRLSQENDVSFLYEAAVCGSIPIIRNLEEYYDNDWLYGFAGIINGSTNFILTQMRSGGLSYDQALKLAQENGFAESDPTLDIEGHDAVNKLSILLAHIYGQHWPAGDILVKGIQSLHEEDFIYAQEKGFDIKLVAQNFIVGSKVTPVVLPTFIRNTSPLFGLDNEYNGVLLKSHLSDEQFLYGKGAGRYPTSSAVLSDLSALRYGYRYEYRKSLLDRNYTLSYDVAGKVFVSFSPESEIDLTIFESVDTVYKSRDRNYIIGDIYFHVLKDSGLLNVKDYSVIFFDETILEAAEAKKEPAAELELQMK